MIAGPAEEVRCRQIAKGGVTQVLRKGDAAGVGRRLQVGKHRLVMQRILLIEDEDMAARGSQGGPFRVGRLSRRQGVRADDQHLHFCRQGVERLDRLKGNAALLEVRLDDTLRVEHRRPSLPRAGTGTAASSTAHSLTSR